MTETRHAGFAVSVDALLQQWARREDAPSGSAYVVSTEISGRLRGGVEWRHENSISVGVLARPRALEPSEIELGWLAASLGAASALSQVTGVRYECGWPDRIDPSTGAGTGPSAFEVAVSSVGHLGPGRIDHIVMIVRIAAPAQTGPLTEIAPHVVEQVRIAGRLLDEPGQLLDRYRETCSTLGRRVSLTLLPHGSVRGRARDVDHAGSLMLESPTGLVESVAVAMLGRLDVIDA